MKKRLLALLMTAAVGFFAFTMPVQANGADFEPEPEGEQSIPQIVIQSNVPTAQDRNTEREEKAKTLALKEAEQRQLYFAGLSESCPDGFCYITMPNAGTKAFVVAQNDGDAHSLTVYQEGNKILVIPCQNPVTINDITDRSGNVLQEVKDAALGNQETICTVNCDRLYFRSGPGTTYSKTDTLKQGTEVKVLSVVGSWTKVQLSDGRVGYVSSRYLSEA